MTLAALIVGLGVGFLLGEHLATRRYNRVLWQHQTSLDWAIIKDLEESNREAKDQLDRLESEVERAARTVH
jgi:hypothetical protein